MLLYVLQIFCVFNVLLGVQTFQFLKTAKMQKIPKNIKILKNDFRIPHHKISFKQFSNICENVVYFFYYVGGWKND